MKKIRVIYFQSLRKEEHFLFLSAFRALLSAYPSALASVAALLPPFDTLLALEERLLSSLQGKGSILTRPILAADKDLDRLVSLAKSIVQTAWHQSDPALVSAAQDLNFAFKKIGKIKNKSRAVEVTAIKTAINTLNNEFSAQAAAVGLTPLVGELQAALLNMEQLVAQRNAELASRPKESTKEVHNGIQLAYGQIINHLNAAATIDTNGTYDEFIAQLNEKITAANNSHHHLKKNLSTGSCCVIDAIATQAYIGKAITPLPVVHYQEEGKPAVELTFAKDFALAYKNNYKEGTANLTIRGKGAYGGSKTVTFNIAKI
jgi:hypothetical protein